MSERIWTVMQALRWTTEAFEARGLESARREAELLLGYATGLGRVELYTLHDRPLSEPERERFRALIKRRSRGEPVQYVLGTAEFWSLELEVSPAVLIPRGDTEVLVEEVLAWARSGGAPAAPRLVDVGTGSGAVALALAKELPEARVVAVDACAEALRVARRNATRHGLSERVAFLHGSLLEPLAGAQVDAVVSNPPYVSSADMATLPPHVAEHEPRLALWGGEDGLSAIRPLFEQARSALAPGGLLACEIGTAAQSEAVRALAEALGYAGVRVRDDYARTPRVVLGRWDATPIGEG